jgi:hypothetical protein
MKAWAWMVVVPLVGTLAHAESLGDVAKRERERREKKGEAAQAKVIREDDLVARVGGAGSGGTFSGAVGSTAGRTNAGTTKPSSAPAENKTGPITEVEAKRLAARERLEASYESIRDTAGLLWQAITQYVPCEGVIPVSLSCQARFRHVLALAWSIGASMADAEDAARQGWLNPGEVRDARRRHGMNDSSWDDLVREVQKYRR